MLTHLSTKFRMGNPENHETHEPRVALILNRFTRTLTVLYASHATTSIFGISPEALTGKSFFECIDENCLQDAVDALERAKENDSIAYLRFQWRDPTNGAAAAVAAPAAEQPDISPAALPRRPLRRSQRISSQTKRKLEVDDSDTGLASSSRPTKRRSVVGRTESLSTHEGGPSSFSDPGISSTQPPISGVSTSASAVSSDRPHARVTPAIREVEAVVSCTSDGLVVILRQARPLIPKPLHNIPNGIFASPWAPVPLVPVESASNRTREISFMEAIREVAVFAWSLRQLGGEIIANPDGENSPALDDDKLDAGASDKGKAIARRGESLEEAPAVKQQEPSSPSTSDLKGEVPKGEVRGRQKNSNRKPPRR
ncbi:hypothetical protein AA313_de0201222 [Arthrobotrys entomopaga]|nr:hypothetical protein AA313_de0201222 [Arthrobotrys entomopaga]